MICNSYIKMAPRYPVPGCALVVNLVTLCVVAASIYPVIGFHLSFGQRLTKSSPQLNPASSLIRPIECRNVNNHTEVGICMFAIDCMQNKGTPLSVCKHNYFVGTCCRLPDYNNFVGIVYDLRDTETGLLLEARKTLPMAPSAVSSPSSSSSLSSVVNHALVQQTDVQSPGSIEQQQAAKNGDVFNKSNLENRYIISSTSLFPTSPSTQSTTASVVTFASATSLNNSNNVSANTDQTARAQPAPEALPIVAESARNVDGSTQTAHSVNLINAAVAERFPLGQQPTIVSSESDAFHIHSHISGSYANGTDKSKSDHQSNQQQQQQQQSAYEIIGSVEPSSNKVTSLTSSDANQQQFSLSVAESPQSQLQQQVAAATEASDVSAKSSLQNSVYLIGAGDASKQQQQNIVFANNHQLQSTSHRPPPPPAQPSTVTASLQPGSDQEFTVGSSTSPFALSHTSTTTMGSSLSPSSTTTTSATTTTTTTPSPAITKLIQSATSDGNSVVGHTESDDQQHLAAAAATTTAATIAQSSQMPSKSSPFVDLVSSSSSHSSSSSVNQRDSSAGLQTTTPFTSSLSTALLPNVSSHPYSPTEPPPQAASLVPAQSFTSSSSHVTTIRAPGSQTSKPSSESMSQLYSNQHSSSTQAFQSAYSSSESDSHHYSSTSSAGGNTYTARPGGILYPSTKIVAANTGANANQLIPSLSGLQSAILSHIPFKIASGLSSGLSSYLQAAMKPSGGGGRPLLSSNTAPALQYQQQQQQQQATSNLTSAKPLTTAMPSTSLSPQLLSAIRFPGGGSTGTPSDQASVSPSTWQQSTTPNGTSLQAAAPSQPGLHDFVRDAQLVCGRPQVSGDQANNNKKRVARIVGGNQSAFGQWPWMVSLRQWRKGLFLHKCGAALLNENWAITAAHCVENVKASDLLLRLGEFDVSNQEEPFPYAERRVKSVVSHPNFDPKTFEYDLALLRFAEPVKFERNIVPVCVPSGNDSYVDRMATVIGWGRLYEDGPLPDVIQHVDVPIITNNECERMYKNAGYIEEIPDMFICAGISKGGRDSCEGDSGGPLTMVDHDGRSYLVGIISWGIGCALPSQPGVYTRITAFSKWINQITAF